MSTVTGFKTMLRVAVASGKGGTGKTTLSTALALTHQGTCLLLDCDVEEPNTALFLSDIRQDAVPVENSVSVPYPFIDMDRCNACGICKEVCEFNAVILLKEQPMFFHELCHSCGSCTKLCPQKALYEKQLPIGTLSEWKTKKLVFVQGEMQVGKAMSPPIIRAVKRRAAELANQIDADLSITDCPPGTSCPMIAAVRDSDVVVLVTEATPFGLHDLKLAVETIRNMKIPFGVVLNRCDVGDDKVQQYCRNENIPLIAEIPHDRKVAEVYSSGKSILEAGVQYSNILQQIHTAIRTMAQTGGSI